MVQTRSAMARIESGQVHDGDGVLVPQDCVVEPLPAGDAPPPTKRQRRDHVEPPKKRRRRKREELCQLNLDVLFLIAKYIHPMDLLNLARTCKSLRDLLMDKSSAFVWKTARQQVRGLPDCPADLTEPEYANLVFCARCHSCGKSARTVLWRLRRRYCPRCKLEQLSDFSYCDEIVRKHNVLAMEHFAINKDVSVWVDKDQMESFLDEYCRSADKKRFLDEKEQQKFAILRHANECERWQKNKALERRDDLALRRDKRENSIFEKLTQHGYGPEIKYFGACVVRGSHKAVFRTSKPLTNKEWDLMWPKWRNIMDDLQLRRMNGVVYQPRRYLLTNEYNTYVASPAPDGPTFDLLPHVVDLACFGPFQDIIKAPEGTQMNDKPFASAFAQLPDLIEGWKNELDAELNELVKIPLHLSSENASNGQVGASSSTGHAETSSDKLHLACALFHVDRVGCFTHLDAFSVSMRDYSPWCVELERTGTIGERYRIKFLEEAPYIVRTCGLDPSVATVVDMDHWNARLRCLSCKDEADTIMDWRTAMWHASSHHKIVLVPLSEAARWQLVSDARIGEIEGVEQRELSDYTRCLLCRRRVGNASSRDNTISHLGYCHNIAKDEIKEGVHYTHVGIGYSPPKAEIVDLKKSDLQVSLL